MTDLDVFLPRIMPYAAGCAAPTAYAAIITAARALCERGRLWRDDDTFNVTPTSCNVICTPDYADLFEIESALLDGRGLDPISIPDLDRNQPDWRNLDGNGGRWITQSNRGEVTVVPKCTGSLELHLYLTPNQDADQLPDFLAKDYRQAIADGALAEILMIPGQPFYAPDRAQFYSARFEAKIASLMNQQIRGQQRAPARTRAQFM